MGAGYHGGFGQTKGKLNSPKQGERTETSPKKTNKQPVFSNSGHVTIESISNRREFFLGKSVAKLENILKNNGYETQRRPSKYATSKAKIIVTTNPSADRNITQVQISSGSKRHGDVPYVKISTSDQGRIKIVAASKERYKTDNAEKATILFRRKRNVVKK